MPNVTMRGLESKGTTIEQSGFFDFDQKGDTRKAYYTYRYIMLNLKQYSSNFYFIPFLLNTLSLRHQHQLFMIKEVFLLYVQIFFLLVMINTILTILVKSLMLSLVNQKQFMILI